MSAFLARAPRRLRVVAALAVFLALAAGAAAQTETGRITGVVTDATGGILPGVTVTAKAVGTGATRELTTDSAGQYVFANLPPGPYEITAGAGGVQSSEQKVTVTVGGAFNVDLKMDVAGTKENVNVVAEIPRINVTNSEVSTTITEAQIRELPTITRNVYDLVAVAGNVSGGKVADGEEWTTTTRGTGYNINGQRASGTNILLDGSANNNEFDTTVGQNVPLDSVQEFSVVTSNFSAQYGRATGGIVNVADQVGHQQLPRNRLRVLPQRQAGDQHLRQQGQRDREGRVHAPSAGLQHRRADPARQGALLHAISNTSACAAPTR